MKPIAYRNAAHSERDAEGLEQKKIFCAIVLILLVLIPIFTYAEQKVTQNNAAKFLDRRNQVLLQITDLENTLSCDRCPGGVETKQTCCCTAAAILFGA